MLFRRIGNVDMEIEDRRRDLAWRWSEIFCTICAMYDTLGSREGTL
jgi:hypothetical protein